MMPRFELIFLKRIVHSALRVRTGIKTGNCIEDCNNDLGVCMSKPAGSDPFALGVNCQADYDQCVNQCMAE